MTDLNPNVLELIELMKETDFFSALRIDSGLHGASLNPLSNNAVDLCINTSDNFNLRLAGANGLRMAIYEHDADLFQAQWIAVMKAVKPLIEEICVRVRDQFLSTVGVELPGDVLGQLGFGCVWRQFQNVCKLPHLFPRLIDVYLAGHLPLYWGAEPDGGEIVYL